MRLIRSLASDILLQSTRVLYHVSNTSISTKVNVCTVSWVFYNTHKIFSKSRNIYNRSNGHILVIGLMRINLEF